MFARLSRIILSFAITLSAYWLYAAVAVPLIERPDVIDPTDDPNRPPIVVIDKQREMLAQWFHPGDWELDSPKLIQTPQGLLLLRNVKVLNDQSRVELKPCTMIFLPPGENESSPDYYRRAVIMRSSPESGAALQFDGPIDISSGKIGRIVGGQIQGNVTIYSQQRSPGPEDDLQIHARDLELTRDRLTSPHAVDLRWGRNTARGNRLKMELSSDDRSLGYRGLLAVELQQMVEVHLESVEKSLMPGGDKPASTTDPKPRPSPVRIKSAGAFRLDLVENVATFQNQVDIERLDPSGSTDQLNCELLSIFFRKPTKEETAAANAQNQSRTLAVNGGPKLEPQRIVAFGQPATVRASSSEVEILAGQIEYELTTGSTTLRDGKEVVLKQGKREIHCRELYAEPDETRKLGRFLAKGEGWLKGALPDDPNQGFQASWTRRLNFRPHEKQHVLSLEGNAFVSVSDRGSVNAEEIHLWLWEKRTTAATGEVQVEMVPDRLMSVGRVTFNSAQITGAVSQLQVWFEQGAPRTLSAIIPYHILAQIAGPPRVPGLRSAIPSGMFPPSTAIATPPTISPLTSLPPTVSPPSIKPEAIAAQPALAANQRIHIEGEQLRVRARQRGQQLELSEAFVEHDVSIRELNTQPTEKPLLITGRQLHMQQQSANETIVTVHGQPAHVEARGMTLDSTAIHMNRLTNAVWTETAGQLLMLVDRDPNGTLVSQPQRLEVAWQGNMEFTGRVARFRQDVVARQQQQLVKTALLEVTLSESVSFAGGPKTKPDVEQIFCRDGVYLENPTFEGNKLVSLDRISASELSLHRPSGQLTAQGPGWVKSVRLGSAPGLSGGGGMVPGVAAPPKPASADPNAKSYIGVEFQGSLHANISRRDMKFTSAVRTIYGPVERWESTLNPDKSAEWHKDGLLINSDELTIVQLPGPTPEQTFYEMAATGNTVVKGAAYTARSARLTYSQAKDMLVIEGDGRTDAELSYQPKPGGTTSKVNSRKIQFWPKSNRVEASDIRYFDANNLNANPGK